MGLSLRCGSLLGDASSFKCIWCCIISELIPLMSLMVHPIASFSFLKTDIKHSSCFLDKWDAIMTGRVSFSPKYAYLRCSGKAFNSQKGKDSLEGYANLISGFDIMGFDAQSTAELMISSKLKSSNSSSFLSSSCSLVKFSM